MTANPFATLLYDRDELAQLAELVDVALVPAERTQDFSPAGARDWAMLNSLRTSLREAQWQLDPTDEPSPLVVLTQELLALRRWKAEAIQVIAAWDECYDLLDQAGQAGQAGPLGGSMAAHVATWIKATIEGMP